MSQSPLWTDVDFDREGVQQGYIRIHSGTHETSDDETGYRSELIPIISIKNGEGPGVLLMAGNHGNEYDGEVMLMRFLQDVRHEDVRGQIIVMPAANAPAVRADQRVSPLDGGNLNRLFFGQQRDGRPTAMIAYFIENELLPRVQYAFDFHSGCRTNEYAPCAVASLQMGKEQFGSALELLKLFGLPFSMIIEHSTGGDRALIGACRRAGVQHMSTELGGGGTVSRSAVAMAVDGLKRSLLHLGVLRRSMVEHPPAPTRFVKRVPWHDYIFAENTESGLFSPCVELGEDVVEGQKVGEVFFPLAPWREPFPIVAKMGGVLLCRHVPARVSQGHCVFVLCRDWSPG